MAICVHLQCMVQMKSFIKKLAYFFSSLSDVGIKKQLQLLHRKQKEYEQDEKKLYSSMFRN